MRAWHTFAAAIGLVAATLAAGPAGAQTVPVRMGKQYGITYLPFVILENQRLIEKHVEASGAGKAEVSWIQAAGGTTLNDALLTGGIDFVATGYPSFLTLWSRGRGRVGIKAIASYGVTPLLLVTRDAGVKTLEDFSGKNRIAVPAVKSSVQAILLQMAAEKIGKRFDHFDPLTTSRSHPDAAAAVMSGLGEIDSHFSAPPYQAAEAEKPGMRTITTSEDIFGGPLSNGVLYTTERFYEANPKAVAAVKAALNEALDIINKDHRRAAQMYLETTREKTSVEDLLKIIDAPGVKFDATPHGVMKFAEFMKRTGAIPVAPASWKDVFFKEAHDLPGD